MKKADKKIVAKKASKPALKKVEGASNLPLFLERPAMLDAKRHEKATVTGDLGYNFARKTNSIPLNAAELVLAAKHYPIVFTNESNPTPCAIVGFEQDNYFVDTKGQWKADTYIPAYVRKYPFAFTELAEAKQLVLCIDEAAKHFAASGKKGNKLYDAGKPTKFTQNALEFCTAFHNHFITTAQFGLALKAAGLLTENHSEAQLNSGRKLKLSGFQLIDQAKFNALPDIKIAELRKKGWLGLIYFTLQATSNWKNLVDLAARNEKPKK